MMAGLMCGVQFSRGQTLYDFGNPVAEEQAYLEMVNRARSNPPAEGARLAACTDVYALAAYSTYGVDLTMMQNEFNTIASAPPLVPNAMLMTAARGHTAWMLANSTQSHNETNPANDPGGRLTATGYLWTTMAENIYATAYSVLYGHVGFEVDWGSGGTGGMQTGRGHRTNIHNPDYIEIGLGYLQGTNTGVNGNVGPTLITQDFAVRNSPPTFGTGVAYYDLNGNGFYDVGEEISGLTVNVSGATSYCTTATGGGWVVPVPSGSATRSVTFTGLGMNQSVPITFTGSANAKADLMLTYTPPTITSPATAYTSTPHTYSFNMIGGAGSYIWNRWTSSAAASELCENAANIASSTTGTYSVICTTLKEQGNSSFQLVSPTSADQSIQLSPLYYGSSSSSITFWSRVGYATTTQYCKVQVMPQGGAWTDVYSVAGSGGAGDGLVFNQRTVSLSSMVGKAFQIRFLYTTTPGQTYYNDTSYQSGWLIDNITFSSVSALGSNVTQALTTSPGTFTPSVTGNYLTSITPVVSGHNFMASYQTLTVSAPTAPAITTQPHAATIANGSTATLTVAASGSEPAYQWYAGSSGVTTNPVVGATSASFTTPALISTTTYWVYVSNGAGHVNSSAATVTVNPPLSTVSTLAGLTLSSGTLSPSFAAASTSYTASVTNATTSITVRPTVTDSTATVKVNGTTVASGAASGAISLSVGSNTITTVVTAQDGITTTTYTITVTRLPSSVCTLSSLVLSSGTLSPTFSVATPSYTASVTNATTSITVTPTVTDATATITVNGISVASGVASGSISLSVGANVITTVVTAQDGVTTNTYTVTVTRAPSTVATLSSLVLSSGTFSPTFAATTFSYTTSVTYATTSITVIPTVTDTTATIKVNGIAVASGAVSGAITLSVGSNTITTIVTAQDGVTTKAYTVTVTRSAASTVATLSGLVLSSGTLSPTFATATHAYTASVTNGTTSIIVTPTVTDATATITVNGTVVTSGTASGPSALSVGSNTITTVVTAQDGVTTNTYTVTVTRAPSTVATLSSLVMSSGTLSPIFAAATTTYTASVTTATTSITVTPTVTDAAATITVNGATVASGAASGSIALSFGANLITIVVTAQDGLTTKTYTVTVTRALSTVATLSGLVPSSGSLSPTFAAATTSYTASVAYAVNSINLTPTVTDAAATIKVNGTTVASGVASGLISLSVGSNTITTIVTAQDGVTTKAYTVTVTRSAASTVATLSSLVLSSGALTPTFAAATISYTTTVANTTTSITVTPVVTDTTATIKVNGTTVASGVASGAISLSVGANTITTVVTAQDGVTTKTYTAIVTLSPTFASWAASYEAANSLAPGTIFSNPTGDYNHDGLMNLIKYAFRSSYVGGGHAAGLPAVSVRSGYVVMTYQRDTSLTDITITPHVTLGLGTWYAPGDSGAPSGFTDNLISTAGTVQTRSAQVPLTAGNKVFMRIIVNDLTLATPSRICSLSSLVLSSATLSPAFAAATLSYTANVPNTTSFITVTPTVTDSTATVKVNGTTVASGAASAAIPLAVGTNTITTVVTAQDGTTQMTYTTTVNVNPTFASWAASYETANSLAPGTISSNPTGDYNHDGLMNLIKYAFKSSYVGGGHAAGLPAVSVRSGYVVMTYQRDTSLTDITVTPHVTLGLGTWYAPGDSGAPSGFTDNLISTAGTVQTRSAQVPLTAADKVFMQIKVTKP